VTRSNPSLDGDSVPNKFSSTVADGLADFLAFSADILTDFFPGLARLFPGLANVLSDLTEDVFPGVRFERARHCHDSQS